MPEILDVLLVDQVWLGNSYDARPCVVIQVSPGKYLGVLLISSATDLFNATWDFTISKEHPDFPQSGLSKTSYVKGYKVFDIDDSMIVKKLGRLTGSLAIDFKNWIGL